MAIQTQQARAIFTQVYLDKFKEMIPAPSFLRSFFATKTFDTRYVGIEVIRGTERIAVDVQRGASGNRNTFSKQSERIYQPPMYNENFDATELDRYDRVFGEAPDMAPKTIGYLASDVAEKLAMLKAKIERAEEYQCMQVLNTGVVTLTNGDNIDFKRKSGSLVDLSGAGGYWSTTTTDIDAQLTAGGAFLRQYGKTAIAELNLITSSAGLGLLKKTDWWKNNAGYFTQATLLDIHAPQKNSTGAVLHGRITAGGFVFNLWTYDEVYEDSTGTITRYLPANKAIVVPAMGSRFEMVYAGIPAIIADTTKAEYSQYIQQLAAAYYVNNYIDPIRKTHTFEVLSAPLAVPVSIDQIYTMKISA